MPSEARRLIRLGLHRGPACFGLALIFLLSSACNHFFYYPQSKLFTSPARFDLRYESFMIPGEPGIDLAAWWIKAQKKNQPEVKAGEKSRGVILQLHGNAENMTSHFLFVAWLAKEGYEVVTFDYRSYGISSPAFPTQEGLVEDACSVLKWIAAHPKLGQLPLFVVGQSLGGAVAIPALVRCPPRELKGLVIDSSFASYRKTARATLRAHSLTWPFQWPLSLLVSDRESPAEAIGQIKVPVLYFHSPKDPVVPYEQGQELFAATEAQKRFIDVNEEGHVMAFAVEDGRYRRELLAFLQKNASN